jgi:hypothetical protein
MSITEIPTDSAPTDVEGAVPFFTERVILGAREYQFRFVWVQREAKWYYDLMDQSGSMIAAGLKLVADFPTNRLLVDDRAPAGTIMCLDTSGEGRDPGLADLGSRCLVLFLDGADAGL